MTDLTEFLLARIAEDEEVAKAAKPGPWVVWRATVGMDPENDADVAVADSGDEYGPDYVTLDQDGMGSTTVRDATHIARWDPARVLAECDAKRRIIAADWRADDSGEATLIRQDVLRLLALPYADHEAYLEEWKP